MEQLLAFARSGDTVIVWKLDRLGRSLKDLIETLNLLKDQGVDFISLTEHIDTTTLGGKLIFHLMGARHTCSRHPIHLLALIPGRSHLLSGQADVIQLLC